jgi:hypothetical protein
MVYSIEVIIGGNTDIGNFRAPGCRPGGAHGYKSLAGPLPVPYGMALDILFPRAVASNFCGVAGRSESRLRRAYSAKAGQTTRTKKHDQPNMGFNHGSHESCDSERRSSRKLPISRPYQHNRVTTEGASLYGRHSLFFGQPTQF